jgi:hypothetical protein
MSTKISLLLSLLLVDVVVGEGKQASKRTSERQQKRWRRWRKIKLEVMEHYRRTKLRVKSSHNFACGCEHH